MRRAAAAVLGSAVVTVLVLIRPQPIAVARRLTAPAAALRQAGPDVVLAQVSATLLWFLAAWLAVGIAATLLAAVPGAAGRVFDATSRRILPVAVRRIVAGSAGLGVLLAPVPAALATGHAPGAHQVATPLPAPVWPGGPSAGHRPDPPPPGHHPQQERPAPPPPGQHPQRERPVPPLPGQHPQRERPASPPADEPAVRVRPGDSLWLIAARRLGPSAEPADIAAAWPRWYAANREVIGADPDLIRPGQLLSPPDQPNGPQR